MKYFFLAIAISAALTISAFARAAEIQSDLILPVKQITYDEDSMVIKFVGNFPNICTASARPELFKTAQQNVLILDIVGTAESAICADVVGGAFEVAFDIRSLKFDLVDLELDPEAQYTIITRNRKFAKTLNFGDYAFNLPFATKEVAGGVIQVGHKGKALVVVSPSEAFEVTSPFIDMADYEGQHVTVLGHELKARMPGVRVTGPRPTRSILVTGINTTPH